LLLEKLNKKGNSIIRALIGLVMVIIVILGLVVIYQRSVDTLLPRINPGIVQEVYALASPDSFSRLSQDIEILLESDHSERTIVYTIGTKYMLIGFNKDKEVNDCIKGDEFIEPPGVCRKKACLCLCENEDEKMCEEKLCVPYKGVDYFIGGKPGVLNPYEGEEMSKIDPATGKNAHCLQINGGKGIDEQNWETQNIYIQRTKDTSGKIFVYLGKEKDAESRSIEE